MPHILYQPSGKNISLIAVEAMRWKAIQKRDHHLETVWTPLFNEMKAVGDFHGISQYGPVYFRIYEEGGLSNNLLQKLSSEHIRTLPITELPKLLDTPLEPNARQTLLKRLAGEVDQIPLHQDLCDRYYRSESILQRYNSFIGSCNELIKKYIVYRCHKHRPKKEIRYGTPILVSLTLNGRSYTTPNPYEQSVRMIYPEDPVYSITENDIRHDETADPYLHGVDRSKWQVVDENGTLLGTCRVSDPNNISWVTTPPEKLPSLSMKKSKESGVSPGSNEISMGSSPDTPPLQGMVEGVGILNPSTCGQFVSS